MDAEILQLLKRSPSAPGLHEKVQEYLKPIKDGDDVAPDAAAQYGKFSCTFMHVVVTQSSLDTATGADLDQLMASVDVCSLCYARVKLHAEFSSPYMPHKLHYHVLTKLVSKELIDECLPMIERLYVIMIDLDVRDLRNKSLSDINRGVFSTLWNYAIKMEQKKCRPSTTTSVLDVQLLSLKYLALFERESSSLVEKATIVLSRYETSAKKARTFSIDAYEKFADGFREILLHDVEHAPSSDLDFSLYYHRALVRSCRWNKADDIIGENANRADSLPKTPTSEIYRVCSELQRSVVSFKRELAKKSLLVEPGKQRELIRILALSVSRLKRRDLDGEGRTISVLDTLLFVHAQLEFCWDAKNAKSNAPLLDDAFAALRDLLKFTLTSLRDLHRSADNTDRKSSKQQSRLCRLPSIWQSLVMVVTNWVKCSEESRDEAIEEVLDAFNVDIIDLIKKYCAESHAIGVMANNCGACLFNAGLYAKSTQFYEIGARYLGDWCRMDKTCTKSRILEVKLWYWFECCADAYRKSNQWAKAQQVVVQGILEDDSNLSAAAEVWMKIKRDAPDLDTNRNLKDALDSSAKEYGHVDIEKLLIAELNAYKKRSTSLSSEQNSVIEALLSLSSINGNPLKKAVVLIEKGQALWTESTQNRSALECFVESVRLLEGVNRNELSYELALAKHWLFIATYSETIKEMKPLPKPKKKETKVNDEDNDIDENEDDIFSDLTTLDAEYQMIVILDESLQLWEDYVPRCGKKDTSFGELNEVMEMTILPCVKSMASLYALFGKPLHELRCLRLVNELCKEEQRLSSVAVVRVYIENLIRLIILLCNLGQLEHASIIVEQLNQALADDNDNDWNLRITAQTVRAEYLRLSGKVAEAYKLIMNANTLREQHCSVNTLRNIKLEAFVRRSLAKFYFVPLHRYLPNATTVVYATDDLDGVLALVYDEIRLNTGVIHSLIGNKMNLFPVKNTDNPLKRDTCSTDQWGVLNEVLTTLLLSAEYYRHAGACREAKCYLLEGLHIAQGFNLPRRVLQFFLAIGELNNLTGCLSECETHLDQCQHVIQSTRQQPTDGVISRVRSSGEEEENKPSSKLIDESDKDETADCFGFDAFIKTKPLDGDYWPKRAQNLASSPSMKRMSVKTVFADSEHADDCLCERCADFALHWLYLTWYGIQAACLRRQEQYTAARKAIRAALRLNKRRKAWFEDALAPLLKSLVVARTARTKAPRQNIVTPMKAAVLDLYVEMTSVSLDENDAAGVAKHVDDCSRILSADGLEDSTRLARVNYLKIANALKRFKIRVSSQLDRLIDGIARVDFSETLTPTENRHSIENRPTAGERASASSSKSIHSLVKGSGCETPLRKTKPPKCSDDQNLVVNDLQTPASRVLKSGRNVSKLTKKNVDEREASDLSQLKKLPTTPRPVDVSRRAVLDWLMESDENEEDSSQNIVKSAKKTRKNNRRVRASNGEKSLLKSVLKPSNKFPDDEKPKGSKSSASNHLKNGNDVDMSIYDIDAESDGEDSTAIAKRKPTAMKRRVRREKDFDSNYVEICRDDGHEPDTNSSVGAGKTRRSSSNAQQSNIVTRRSRSRRTAALASSAAEKQRAVVGVANGNHAFEDETDGAFVYEKLSISSAPKSESDSSYHESCDIALCCCEDLPPVFAEENVDVSPSDIEIMRACSDEENDEPALRPATRGHSNKKSSYDEKELTRRSQLCGRLAPARNGRAKKVQQRKVQIYEESPGEKLSAELDDDALIAELESTLELVKHFPQAVLYRCICHALALVHYRLRNAIDAAFYLTESMAVTFRHQLIVNTYMKRRKCIRDNGNHQSAKLLPNLKTYQTDVQFLQTRTSFEKSIQNFPEDWIVCQLTVISVAGQDQLFISRFSSRTPVIIRRVEGFTENGKDIIATFRDILSQNRLNSTEVTEQTRWWKYRIEANTKLEILIKDMEEKLLRPWKGLLLSEPADESNRQRLQQAASAVSRICEKLGCSLDAECQQMLRILLNSAHLYDDIQPLYQAVKESFPAVSEANARQIAAAIRKYSNKLESAALKRSPLILVLDRLLQMMPWDSIPMLINHPVSRMLSIYAISAELRLHGEDDTSVYNVGVDARKAYYILDPDNNLPHTKQTFSKWFKKQGWPGICGSLPSADDYKDALTNNDLFMYLGHGSGTRYVKGEILQSIQSRVVSFIMGCSSGLLQVQGDLEVTGTMLNYLFSGGPVAIGNLWDITDRDIDRFFEQLITAWFRSAEGTTINELMCQARSICRMQFLNGAAPAIYGLPVGLKFAELKS